MHSACHEQLDCLLSLITGSRFAINVSTDSTKKWYASTVSSQARYVPTDSTQAVYVSTIIDRGRTFRPSSTEEKHFDHVRSRKNVSTEFDRRVFLTEKNLDREKTVRLCSTEEKCFDRVQMRSFFDRDEFRLRKKNISNVFDRGKTFRPRSFFGRKKIFRLRFFAADCRKHIQF